MKQCGDIVQFFFIDGQILIISDWVRDLIDSLYVCFWYLRYFLELNCFCPKLFLFVPTKSEISHFYLPEIKINRYLNELQRVQ